MHLSQPQSWLRSASHALVRSVGDQFAISLIATILTSDGIAGEMMEKAGQAFTETGKVGKQFTEDGKVGEFVLLILQRPV